MKLILYLDLHINVFKYLIINILQQIKKCGSQHLSAHADINNSTARMT